MRYILLQQVGGPAWMVYDSERGIEIKTFTDKYAKDVAAELAGVLNRGSSYGPKVSEIAQTLPAMQQDVRIESSRRKVLHGNVQSESKEG